MKYIIKNIKSFINSEKLIFLLVLLCVVTSSFIINFSYGLYQNYKVLKEEEENELDMFYASFDNSGTFFASKEKLKSTLLTFSDELNEAVDMYFTTLTCEELKDLGDNIIIIRFCIKNGNIVPCELFEYNLTRQGLIYSGRYLSEEEEKNGERVALIEVDNLNGKITEDSKRLVVDDETVMFQGNEYKIIGTQTLEPLIVPFNSLNDNTPINEILFHFKKPVTRSQYSEIKEKLELNFPDIVQVPDLDIPEAENYYLYNTIILISILIAVLAAINFAFLYRYILSKRTKTLAVYRICGCTKAKALGMFLGECMLIAIPAFTFTTLAYDRLVLPKLGRYFEYIESAYSPKLYLLISAIYITVTFIVLVLMMGFEFLNKKIVEAKGE